MIARHAATRLLEALDDTPVVYLQGARQTGKSTLAKRLAEQRFASYLTLDTAAVLAAATNDPDGFVAGLARPAVIDEAQRAPALPLAIKAAVDANRRPGQFLLTGSAGALALPKLADSLAGRMELHTLWPFSQGETQGVRETFIDRLFAEDLAPPPVAPCADDEVIDRLCGGGYPDALARRAGRRRSAWFDAYVTTVLERDVRSLANIDRLLDLPRLLGLLAARVGQLINHADLARSLGLPQTTLKRYMALLEATFLVCRLPAWFTNVGKRLAKAPKLLLADTGLLMHLLDVDATRLRRDRTLLGPRAGELRGNGSDEAAGVVRAPVPALPLPHRGRRGSRSGDRGSRRPAGGRGSQVCGHAAPTALQRLADAGRRGRQAVRARRRRCIWAPRRCRSARTSTRCRWPTFGHDGYTRRVATLAPIVSEERRPWPPTPFRAALACPLATACRKTRRCLNGTT